MNLSEKTMATFEVGLNAFCILILLQAYGGQEVECDSLNVTGPCNLIGSGLLGGVALLEWVWPC